MSIYILQVLTMILSKIPMAILDVYPTNEVDIYVDISLHVYPPFCIGNNMHFQHVNIDTRIQACLNNLDSCINAAKRQEGGYNMKKILLIVVTMLMVTLGAVAPVMAEENQTLTPVQQQSQENHDAWSQAHGMPTNSSFVGTIVGVLPVGIVLAIAFNVGRTALLLGGGTKKTSAVAKNEALATSNANAQYSAAQEAIAMMDNAAAQDANNNMMF